MLRRLIKRLTNNLGLKILALLFAVAMWMAVVNISDPTINRPFTAAVTIENENVVTAMNIASAYEDGQSIAVQNTANQGRQRYTAIRSRPVPPQSPVGASLFPL